MKLNQILKTIMTASVVTLLAAVPASASYGVVSADILTVRTAPGIESDAVGYLNWGDDVTITYEPCDGWYEIYLNDGCYYVSSEFITSDLPQSPDYGYADYGYTDYGYGEYTEDGVSYEENVYDTTVTEDNTAKGKYLGNFTLTAYCGCASCCGTAGNLTASGTVPTAGRTVAMGGVPFGTKLLINGNVYTVEDRGTSYGVVDIFCNSHSDAIAFGMQSAEVYQLD